MLSLSKQSKLLYLQNRDILTLIFHFPQTNKKKNIVEDIMKKTFLLFILALCSIALFAQNEDWFWAKKAGGTSYDNGLSIAIDANENSYVTGYFSGSATFGTTTLTSSSEYYSDIFVAKLDNNSNWLWVKQAGGTNWDYGYGIAVDANGNSYVTGYFYNSATFGTTTLTSSGYADIFVAKLDSSGNWLWAKQAGEQVLIMVMALLLMTMEIAILQVFLKKLLHSALLH